LNGKNILHLNGVETPLEPGKIAVSLPWLEDSHPTKEALWPSPMTRAGKKSACHNLPRQIQALG